MKRKLSAHEKSYIALLSPEDRRRYTHIKRGGRIVGFVLQYETQVAGQWLPVVRYDCAHGAAHKDVLDIRGRQEKHLLGLGDLREAIAAADRDIRQQWPRYKKRFLAGRRRR